jgi:hypothetical protein
VKKGKDQGWVLWTLFFGRRPGCVLAGAVGAGPVVAEPGAVCDLFRVRRRVGRVAHLRR